MKINNDIFISPVLQVGVNDCYQLSSPENLGNFIFQTIKFPKFSGGTNERISIPALKDGANEYLEIKIHGLFRLGVLISNRSNYSN